MSKINLDTTIGEVVENHPELLEVLSQKLKGQCLGCPMAQIETLGEAAEHHEIDAQDLVEELNKKMENSLH